MAENEEGKHNQNARKHGLYSRYFTADEVRELLEFAGVTGLEAEIAMIRVAMARMLKDAHLFDSPDGLVFATARGLDALGRALKVQRELEGNGGSLAGALEEALERLGIAGDEP